MARPDIHGSTRVACRWSQVTERDPSDPLAAGVVAFLHGFSKFFMDHGSLEVPALRISTIQWQSRRDNGKNWSITPYFSLVNWLCLLCYSVFLSSCFSSMLFCSTLSLVLVITVVIVAVVISLSQSSNVSSNFINKKNNDHNHQDQFLNKS